MLKQLSKPAHRQKFVDQFFEGVKLSEEAKSELADLADQIDVSKMDDAVKAILRFTDKHVESKVVRAKIKGMVLDKTRALRNVHKEISGLTKKLKDL
ncbi:hypothetical protein AAVH_02981 [Aphelenchoides avenae]|nr:hypothetical protein AAVH_02981 [Aphelenchus avenae]